MEGPRLKRILELKRRIEQARKGEVVAARDELDRAQLSALHAQAERRARFAALAEESEQSVLELADKARSVVLAEQRLGSANKAVAERHRLLTQHEEARVLATREVRTFEVLSERDREQQRLVTRNREQRAADEVASTRREKP